MAMCIDEAVVEDAICYIRELFCQNAGGHDVEHTLRVYANTLRIAETTPDCDKNRAALAALLHDADDHKLVSTQNNENARRFLKKHSLPLEEENRICSIVNSVSFSKNPGKKPETIEGQVVQDADRLDAMGAVGIARTFAYGGEHGRPMQESLQHFYDKLLLLKDLMNTDAGRKAAVQRHAFLETFLAEYMQETESTRPAGGSS